LDVNVKNFSKVEIFSSDVIFRQQIKYYSNIKVLNLCMETKLVTLHYRMLCSIKIISTGATVITVL